MAKAKARPSRARPPAKKGSSRRLGLLRNASKKLGRAAVRLAKAVKRPLARPKPEPRKQPAQPAAPAAEPKARPRDPTFLGPLPDKPLPRATKLPPPGEALTKREMEQLLTAGVGRGVEGEGSLKGRLVVRDSFPYLHVIGRDKRELWFLLQGPDQEVLPAYLDHKVSVTGLVRKTTNYGGTVEVRKYSAKRPDEVPAPAPEEQKLRYLSPGEVEQLCAAGMGAGMRGYCALRGNLEMTGDDFILVLSNAGTRQQVSFLLTGKLARGLRKHVGQSVQVSGVVDKTSGWGGSVAVEAVEPRPMEHRAVSRDAMELVHVEASGHGSVAEAKVNHGLTVRLQERAGYIWAIEPMTAKRVGLREANYEPRSGGPATREFFFTPRNPGGVEVEFFLAKVFAPAQVARTFKLSLTVKP
ncbi:MAG: protease inhibitor I42 family protein [Myxococcales bacterium]|nr:protease inhibitor I42 family protein [Myxococcales bacterium]